MANDDNNKGVGYRRPPKQHQFKKGQSGNPKGRPKGTKDLKTDLENELNETLEINEGGKVRRISKQRALIKSQVAKAIKGDGRAALNVMQLKLKFDELEAGLSRAGVELDADEAETLEILKKRLLRRVPASPNTAAPTTPIPKATNIDPEGKKNDN
jgi:hypothetical protein